jgi:predicted metal-dependent phosphoesterase TrpH/glycosyltransferase involved in cell wall biosynthesis
VTPYALGVRHEVNEFARRVSEELAERGHRVLIAGPSESRSEVRESRAAIRAAGEDPSSLFATDGDPRMLAVGQGIPVSRRARPRITPMPLDGGGRTLEELLSTVPFDFVHVHEPFAPSAAWTALRHSRSLNVGTFHEPAERLVSTQVARPLIDLLFGRLDARGATCAVTMELLERYFPGHYDLVQPGADVGEAAPRDGTRLRILFCLEEERGALRLFLRGLRRVSLDRDWEVLIWSEDPTEPMVRVNRRLRERINMVGPRQGSVESLIASADVLCVASAGHRPAPDLIRKAHAAGIIPVASHLPIHQELTADGETGLLFPVGDHYTLAGQLTRLIESQELRDMLRRRAKAAGASRSWALTADQLEETYERVAARRHADGKPEVRRKIAARDYIECDLHMHTDHSPDCATPVDVLLETARDRGLGAIAITDHNEISGALEAREAASEMDGLQVIVAEEVKTAEQGEVIGLFLEEKIERGMTMAETIAEIRRQGGLVYVPHPFDRLHSVPDYEHLLDIVEDIDILEVFNPRVAFSAFNEEAERFAAKYRIVPGAGSDSHVAQGLGSVRIRLRDFEGPEEFLEAMRDADIVHKHKNLVYVQALKFLQTTGRPRSAKRARAAKQPKAVRGGQRRRGGPM